ncbi:MAG TPA: protein translocase subunit SecD [Vicinamibacterales bacterium]|jgi:preprotein translocase subunit SecD|nr:protein translocase subunit SecD [Vicinamibacterales bacterium]
MKNLRWKLLTVLTLFVIFFGIGVYPLLATKYKLPAPKWLMDKQLKLGLDLKGGVHLVLRVHTSEALQIHTTTTVEQVREALRTAGVTPGGLSVTSPTTFRVEGVPSDRDAEFRRVVDDLVAANYDRTSQAGGAYTFAMKPNIERDMREQTVVQAQDTIDRRVNELGVSEPNISRYGNDGEQLLVQLPGVTDVNRAKEIIRSTALLELKLVEAGPAATREALLQAHGGKVPEDMEVVSGASNEGGAAGTSFYLVRKVAAVTGQDLRNARPSLDENSRPAVGFSLTNEGARKFGKVTGENVGRSLAIILDKRVQSAPRIDGAIHDEGRIYGAFTTEEVNDLSLILRSGALPASMSYLEERVIGPTLGQDSVKAGVAASLAGLALVILFMLVYYKLSGINAILAMLANLVILIGAMAYFGAAMTLPGIAGFILTMGMGVDSNVLIFERIKEELAAGKGVRSAIDAGFSRVFLTLLDTHITALIAAAFLFQFGTGPIRGFATTLTIGLLTNLFTSIFVSKTLFELALQRQPATARTISI